MDYRLLVKINNKWQQLDLGDEKPSMNYSQNDIGDLKDRRSNYSHKLQLPLSNNNLKVFGMLDRIEVMSNIPDNLLPCLLYCNEYEIVGSDGLMQIISVSNDNITVQLMSGMVDLFEELKNSKMSDLDLGTFRAEDQYFLPKNFTDFSIVGIASFGQQHPAYAASNMGNTLPFARFIKVVDKILESHGYTLDTDIRADVQDVVLPVVVPPQKPSDYAEYFILSAENQTTDHSTGLAEDWRITQNKTDELKIYSGAESELFWTSPRTKRARIYIYVETASGQIIPSLRLLVTKNGNTILDKHIGLGAAFDQEVDVDKGDVYMFKIQTDNKYTEGKLQYNITINTKRRLNTDHFFHLPVPIASSLGFDTQLNMLKAFINTFGLFVNVDNEKKVVTANTFRKVTDAKTQRINWTKKVDMSSFDCEFHNQNFAIHNHIRFENNTKEDVTDICAIDVSDKTLQYEKDIVKLPFEAGKDGAYYMMFGAAFIPLIKLSNDTNKEAEINATKPHLCILGERKQYDFGIGGRWYSVVKHYKSSDIKKYYAPLFETLKQYRKITLKMLLKPQDLTIVQRQIPVYLQQFGSYFYVNSVKNYIYGQLAEVELMRV